MSEQDLVTPVNLQRLLDEKNASMYDLDDTDELHFCVAYAGPDHLHPSHTSKLEALGYKRSDRACPPGLEGVVMEIPMDAYQDILRRRAAGERI